MSAWFAMHMILARVSHSTESSTSMLACVDALAPARGAAISNGPGAAVVATYDGGWNVFAFDRTMSYRCAVPVAVETCFRANPKCPAFDFLLAHPRDGVRVTFDGTSIDDHAKIDRLSAARPVARGIVDGNGRILAVVPGSPNPVLGLKCTADRGPVAPAALGRALRTELAGPDRRGRAVPACAPWTVSEAYPSNPLPATPTPMNGNPPAAQ